MKNSTKRKNIIPPVQAALFTGIAGILTNSILEAVMHNQQLQQDKHRTVDPKHTQIFGRKSAKADVNVDEATERVVEENCAYITPADNDSHRYYLTQNVNIGRYPHNDIQLTDEAVSRVHCRIVISEGEYYLIDMDATTPATLNGVPVDNSRPSDISDLYKYRIKDGDAIVIGRTTFRFRKPDRKQSDCCSRPIDFSGTVRF